MKGETTMKTYVQTMKNFLSVNRWLALMLTAVLLTGCSTDDMQMEQDVRTSELEAQKGEMDDVMKLLAAVPGVTDITKLSDSNNEPIYHFNFTQKADHSKADSYTFKQAASLRFVGTDAPVVLETQGYGLTEAKNDANSDLATYLEANTLELEYRYFNSSQPEANELLSYRYLTAEQAAFDLHELVSAFKQSLFKNSKWVASGTSKGGINAALYAYYDEKNGWNDMDLYLPFCAPFLTGSATDATDPQDKSTGNYLAYNCGSGYDTDSNEEIGFKRLQQLPVQLADSANLRKVCIDYMVKNDPNIYQYVLKNVRENNTAYTTGDVEKDLTAMVIGSFYGTLFQRFSYLQYSMWASLVPDGSTAMDDISSMMNLLSFVFDDNDTYMKKNFTEPITRGTADPISYELGEFITAMDEDKNFTYEIQAMMQFGFSINSYSLMSTSSYLTPAETDKVAAYLSSHNRLKKVCQDYNLTWDGGELMKAFRTWVVSQTSKPMVFIYGLNDPWTGGRIPTPDAGSKSEIIYNSGGYHSNTFLHPDYTFSSAEIKAAIDKYMKK